MYTTDAGGLGARVFSKESHSTYHTFREPGAYHLNIKIIRKGLSVTEDKAVKLQTTQMTMNRPRNLTRNKETHT